MTAGLSDYFSLEITGTACLIPLVSPALRAPPLPRYIRHTIPLLVGDGLGYQRSPPSRSDPVKAALGRVAERG